MPHRFTETFIKGLQPPAKGARWEWDSELTGFLIRIFAPTKAHPAGTRTFYLSYWLKGEHRYRIGSWPDWSVTAARAEAKAIRQRVDRGEDPATARRELRDAPTMQDLWERYQTEHLPRKAAKSQREDTTMAERHILPHLSKDRRVAEVHHADIVALHRAITESGRPVLANRVLACASMMFSLALKPMQSEAKAWRDHAQGNPCRGIKFNREDGRERFLSAAELAAVSDALTACGTTPAATCIRLVMLTGCRPSRGEIGDLGAIRSARLLDQALKSYQAAEGASSAIEPGGAGTNRGAAQARVQADRLRVSRTTSRHAPAAAGRLLGHCAAHRNGSVVGGVN
jgi:hypothetical protein